VRAVYLLALLVVVGCGNRIKYVQTNTAPGPLYAKQPNEVEVFEKPPARPFLQLGIFEAEQKSAYDKADALVAKIRKEAGKIGCEAVVIQTTIADGGVGLKSFRAACLVYTAPAGAPAAAASSPAPPEKTQVCSPNETRICYGPGACQGGQYCLPDGSAYSACDCGTKGDAGVPPGSQK